MIRTLLRVVCSWTIFLSIFLLNVYFNGVLLLPFSSQLYYLKTLLLTSSTRPSFKAQTDCLIVARKTVGGSIETENKDVRLLLLYTFTGVVVKRNHAHTWMNLTR